MGQSVLASSLQQPLHLVLLQRHVDLDGGVAGDAGSDVGADPVQVQRLLLALELLQDLVQQVLDFAGRDAAAVVFTAMVRDPKGSTSKPLRFSSSEISAKTAI